MPTLPIAKTAEAGQETTGGQRHLSLPRLRVSIQPAAVAAVSAPQHGHGIWIPGRNSLADARPLVLRQAQDEWELPKDGSGPGQRWDSKKLPQDGADDLRGPESGEGSGGAARPSAALPRGLRPRGAGRTTLGQAGRGADRPHHAPAGGGQGRQWAGQRLLRRRGRPLVHPHPLGRRRCPQHRGTTVIPSYSDPAPTSGLPTASAQIPRKTRRPSGKTATNGQKKRGKRPRTKAFVPSACVNPAHQVSPSVNSVRDEFAYIENN